MARKARRNTKSGKMDNVDLDVLVSKLGRKKKMKLWNHFLKEGVFLVYCQQALEKKCFQSICFGEKQIRASNSQNAASVKCLTIIFICLLKSIVEEQIT